MVAPRESSLRLSKEVSYKNQLSGSSYISGQKRINFRKRDLTLGKVVEIVVRSKLELTCLDNPWRVFVLRLLNTEW